MVAPLAEIQWAYTNQQQQDPVVGRTVGAGVGAVTGNVAGAVFGVGEGVGAAAKSAFDNTQRVVRYWKEEKTADGRIILIKKTFWWTRMGGLSAGFNSDEA